MSASLQGSGVVRILMPVYNFWKTDFSQTVTSIFGTAFILYVLGSTLLLVLSLLRPGNLQVYCHSETGSWALVTGASDGIGRAFSAALLSRGFNVLLHGRNEKKLEGVKRDLLERYPKRTIDIVIADTSKNGTFEAVTWKVKQLPGKLTVLVNNVGGVNTYPQYLPLTDVPHEDIDTQINTNVGFATHLTKDLLPILHENGPSLVLNCGSAGGTIGTPYILTYTSCKAYIHAFSTSLKNELTAEHINNIDVLGFIIGNVTSSSNKHSMPFWTITADECAASCLDRVGSPESLVCGHWKHGLQCWPLKFLPERMIRNMIATEMRKRREAEMREMKET